jgi:hypothetical protein
MITSNPLVFNLKKQANTGCKAAYEMGVRACEAGVTKFVGGTDACLQEVYKQYSACEKKVALEKQTQPGSDKTWILVAGLGLLAWFWFR